MGVCSTTESKIKSDAMTDKLSHGNLFLVMLVALISVMCGSATEALPAEYFTSDIRPQEKQCIQSGWQRLVLNISGLPREILWRAPEKAWTKGAIIVLHGGGGSHFQFCVPNVQFLEPQVKFTGLALEEGFAVFLLNSSDQVRDNEGRVCGKVWDDEVRNRPNLDLPFIEEVIRAAIPKLRPQESRKEIFLTGLSSGGYMTVRAATHFDDLITAFAPVSSGDPYGWHRICEKGLTPRIIVHGAGLDNETGKQITERGACLAKNYLRETAWESANPEVKPVFRVFHHKYDGVHDASCCDKVDALLRSHGYAGEKEFLLDDNRERNLANHLWQEAYNRPILDFFISQINEKK
jgi:poly(3-hydroxybutyrate) depolymerase